MIQEARGEVVAATRLRLKHCLHMPLRQAPIDRPQHIESSYI
jgi:hypothetical protein